MTFLKQTAGSEVKPSPEEWYYNHVAHFMNGIELSAGSRLIPDTSVIAADNVRLTEGRVLRDTGYSDFGDAVRGAPRRCLQWTKNTGVTELLLITDDTFYRWSSSQQEWQYMSDGVSTTLDGGEPMSETDLVVDDITGFSDGDYIGIILDDGTQHQTTVSGAPSGSTITIADALPSAAGDANEVVKAIDLSGSADIPVSVDAWPATDKFYFTNGVDAPLEYDGATVEEISNLPGTTFVCRSIVIFANRLLLMNTIEDGTARRQRVRWSEIGVDNDFNSSVNFNDLYDHPGEILTAEKLGIYLIVYKEKSITRVEFLGIVDQTFDFLTVVDNEGVISGAGVVNVGDAHIFFGTKNVYRYDGTFQLSPIGDAVIDIVFGQNGDLNPLYSQRVFGVLVEELDEIWFFYPAGSDSDPQNMLRYNIVLNSFTTRSFSATFSGYGTYLTQDSKTWNDLIGTWSEQTWNWNSRTILSNTPTILLCGKDDTQVFEYDYIQTDDDGSGISYVLETKDFNSPNRELRFDRYDFLIRGTSVLIEVSYDEGASYETLGTVSPGGTFTKTTLHRQAVGDTVRFRFSGSGAFGLKYIGFRFKEETVR